MKPGSKAAAKNAMVKILEDEENREAKVDYQKRIGDRHEQVRLNRATRERQMEEAREKRRQAEEMVAREAKEASTRRLAEEEEIKREMARIKREGFEHDLGHLFTVSLWVKWGFSQKNGLFFWCNTEFVVEGVVPDLFHIIPVDDDSVFNWVFQGKDTSLGLGFITYIGVFLSHTDHDTLVSWASNDGWEDSSWSVISSESSFAHAGAIVNNQSGYVFVTHCGLCLLAV